MLSSIKLKFWAASMIFILSTSFSLPNAKNVIGAQIPDRPRSDAPTTPLSTDLQIDHAPALGESATISCIVSSALDAPETEAQIELPADAELVSGSLNWQGDISAGDSVTLSVVVAFNAAGNNMVSCRALRVVDESSTWGDLARLYLNIGEDVGAMGFVPRPKGSVRGQLLQAGTSQTTSSSVNAQGLLTVTGRWGYYDRNNNFVGAKGMYVELTRADLPYANLAWCVTDDNGFYNCGPVANPGAVGIKTWISAYSTYGPYNDLLTVLDPERGTDPSLYLYNYYQISSDLQVLPDGTQDIGTWEVINGNDWEGAFWIQRDLGDVWRYIYNSTGSTQVPQETAGPAIAEWNFTSTDGSYYLPGEHIHLEGVDSETTSVTQHEYGHNIMYNLYGYFPESFCPSPHFIELVGHVNCAWTEGWADFLTLAVNNDPIWRFPGGGTINLETAAGFDDGDAVEGRVAGALWDIFDAVNDGTDQYSDGGFVNIWDTIYHQNNNTFKEYWFAWVLRGHNSSNAVRQSIYQNTIDYRFSPWLGGVSISSSQPVVTVGRPHVGAEVASYNGFSAGALTAYIPMLFKDAFGGTYDAAFYVQNVHATNTANITIKYYDSVGNLSCTVNGETIAPLASKGYWVPGQGCLPTGWIGGVVVSSDQPIVAIGRPHIGAEVLTYDGFSAGSTTSYIPMMFKDAFGGSYDSAFYVQNVHATNTANITIKYYDSAGALSCTVNGQTIAPLASKGYWLPGEGCLTAGWIGGVVVTSDQPIVAVGRPHIGDQVTTYNGFSAGVTSSYVPMLFKDAFGGSYDAAYYVQNVHATNPAHITIKYYDSAGVLSCTVNGQTIAPLASKGYWVPGEGCLTTGWVGGAVITSDQPIVTVGRPHIAEQVTTYNGFTAGSLNSYLPMLFKDAFGGSYDSAVYIQNTSSSTAANVTLKFYDANGSLSCTRIDSIPALSTLGYWLPSVSCSP